MAAPCPYRVVPFASSAFDNRHSKIALTMHCRCFPYGLIVLAVVLFGGCSLFSPRTPEEPIADGGTYLQPDTPEQVIVNMQAAIEELNTQNYRRSLAESFRFEPTATAAAQDPSIWAGWSREQENTYFSALVADAQFSSGHELRLSDDILSFIDPTTAQFDATYQLTIQHRRSAVPTTVRGRLIWDLVQGTDGLWALQQWTDRETGTMPSWSDLKAAFVK